MNTIIEIGANVGFHTEQFAADQNNMVYAFEPSPVLYPDLIEKFKGKPNIIVLPIAIAITNGFLDFNVCEFGDLGFGSLYDFHPNLLNTTLKRYHEYNSQFSYKQKVMSMRLDTFMGIYSIDHVDVLWIDAQGNDFQCIQSAGEKIRLVAWGRCECMYEIPIYTHSEHNYHADVQAYLELYGFEVHTDYVHEHNSEIDLSFTRK